MIARILAAVLAVPLLAHGGAVLAVADAVAAALPAVAACTVAATVGGMTAALVLRCRRLNREGVLPWA